MLDDENKRALLERCPTVLRAPLESESDEAMAASRPLSRLLLLCIATACALASDAARDADEAPAWASDLVASESAQIDLLAALEKHVRVCAYRIAARVSVREAQELMNPMLAATLKVSAQCRATSKCHPNLRLFLFKVLSRTIPALAPFDACCPPPSADLCNKMPWAEGLCADDAEDGVGADGGVAQLPSIRIGQAVWRVPVAMAQLAMPGIGGADAQEVLRLEATGASAQLLEQMRVSSRTSLYAHECPLVSTEAAAAPPAPPRTTDGASLSNAPVWSGGADGSGAVAALSAACARAPLPTAAAAVPSVPLVGLMITRGDEGVLGEWLRANMRFLDALVMLDGSSPPATDGDGEAPRPTRTREVLGAFLAECPERAADVHYLHEWDEALRPLLVMAANDQTLRAIVHRRIREVYRTDELRAWVLIAHPDEFYYDDPRAVAAHAEAAGADHSYWNALHVLPHPSERAAYEARRAPLVQRRFRHFHHDLRGLGQPMLEGRLFRDGPAIAFGEEHYVTLPEVGLRAPWPTAGGWQAERLRARRARGEPLERAPSYLHYKVVDADPSAYTPVQFPSARGEGQNFTIWAHREHFLGTAPVGVYHNVSDVAGFFVHEFEDYTAVERFDGCLDGRPWALGASFRARRRWALAERSASADDDATAAVRAGSEAVWEAEVGADGSVSTPPRGPGDGQRAPGATSHGAEDAVDRPLGLCALHDDDPE